MITAGLLALGLRLLTRASVLLGTALKAFFAFCYLLLTWTQQGRFQPPCFTQEDTKIRRIQAVARLPTVDQGTQLHDVFQAYALSSVLP